MENLAEKLGARIRRFRLAANMSQGDLACAARLTKSYLSDVERGKVNISIANLDKIAEALEVSLSLLLDCEDSSERADVLQALEKLPDDALLAIHRLSMMLGRRGTCRTAPRLSRQVASSRAGEAE